MAKRGRAVKDIVIFDLDGTLALMEHRVHLISGPVKDWDAFFEACDQDEPNYSVIAMLHALCCHGYKIWIVTGRSETTRRKTVEWLETYGIQYDQLIMRSAGNRTVDTVLKQHWLNTVIPKDRVICVYEDRDSVVKMWRENGITCFQVADGQF